MVVNGLHRACVDARATLGIRASLIMCFLRHLSEEEAFEALEQVLPLLDYCLARGFELRFQRMSQSLIGNTPR